MLAATLDRSLNPNAQIVMESTGPDSAPTLVGSGQLLSNGDVNGFGIFSLPMFHWNAVVPLETRNASKYVLAFDNIGALKTGVALASLAALQQNVQVIVRDDAGAQIGNPTIPLSALGHTSFMLDSPPAGIPSDERQARHHRVRYASRRPAQRAGPASQRLAALTTLPVLAERRHYRRLHRARGV